MEVLRSRRFILGPVVDLFETELAGYCGVARCVGVSSGTDALLVALMSEGIGPGDEVITTPFTFFSTVGAICRVGAKPVFVDIDPDTYNLDHSLVARAITPRTRAIIPVHLFGQMASMQPILDMAERHGFSVIEDACQSLGAKDGAKPAGSLGLYGCFSFFPSKNLGGAGDGGMVVSRDPERANRVRRLRNHGAAPKYHHELVGGNFRLDALQAAVLRAKLPYLEGWIRGRESNSGRYRKLLAERCSVGDRANDLLQGASLVLPYQVPDTRHVYNQFVIRVRERDAVCAHLTRRGIGHAIYYPIPLHRQPCFSDLGYGEGSLPCSERAAREVIALPIYPELTAAQQLEVVEAVVEGMEPG
jgi:dTDP-4-amino-4,6-dideoxygalactose transaminase